ncbi:MAG: RNase adapter RapZ [Clostridia bacterium]|nr:RNase adapter RapZ [Clostridia bacterium]MBQ4575755.1 RNase adapter RapZ [Clostridia bacterium]
MEFIVLTGLSGAGKSQAENVLEDLGYYCIDNMPVLLIPKFVEIYTQTPGKSSNVAFIIDTRGENEFDTMLTEIQHLKSSGYNCRTFFLDCETKVIINRYKETRRIHPLVTVKNISMSEAVETERRLLSGVKESADFVIDTSYLTVAQLREKISAILLSDTNKHIVVTCMSFGFKYGIAGEADLVFDVRCMPNPFYIEELKNKTGLDKEVYEYVFSFKKTTDFIQKLFDMIDYLLPLYIEEGKSQLTIAIGCTGGKHRSVAIAEALNAHLKELEINTLAVHRDIIKKTLTDK